MPGEQRTETAFAMSVTAAVRARLGVLGGDKSGRWLAGQIGVSSNYLAKRLRDVSPLTVDDLARIVATIEPSMTPGEVEEGEVHGKTIPSASDSSGQERAHPLGPLVVAAVIEHLIVHRHGCGRVAGHVLQLAHGRP